MNRAREPIAGVERIIGFEAEIYLWQSEGEDLDEKFRWDTMCHVHSYRVSRLLTPNNSQDGTAMEIEQFESLVVCGFKDEYDFYRSTSLGTGAGCASSFLIDKQTKNVS